ncbi:trypsin-like peptidase domain-containing protein [Candidatus Woesearchaeota archaeon]|nr:trypsin-like peptidase domain-containing protein [Candidatus Woesearchaeota archaeon]
MNLFSLEELLKNVRIIGSPAQQHQPTSANPHEGLFELMAFANASNWDKGGSTRQSIDQITKNIVHVYSSGALGLQVTPEYVITAKHALHRGQKHYVENQAGQKYKVKGIWASKYQDIAIARIERSSEYQGPARIHLGKPNRKGTKVILHYQEKDAAITQLQGEITNTRHDTRTAKDIYHSQFMVDIPTKPGYSGSPVCNTYGELLGFVSTGCNSLPPSSCSDIQEAVRIINTMAGEAFYGRNARP